MKNPISQETAAKILDDVYEKIKVGIPFVSKPVEDLADEYLKREPDHKKAAKNMIKYQIAKCTTSGFVTGFGGAVSMIATVPVNITSVLYVQMRMIAATAYMGGYDLDEDQVQTFVYACLAGVSVNEIVKKFGVNFGQKLATAGVKKIPGRILTKINQKLGFRFITKFGEKGLINLGKLVPVVGSLVNGGFDLVETKLIADRAYKMFIKHDYTVGEQIDDIDEIIINSEEATEVNYQSV